MIYAVFLCDVKWKISLIRQCREELCLGEGDILTELVSEKEELTNCSESHYALELTFQKQNLTLLTVIEQFQEGNLVVLARIGSDQEFIELNRAYTDHQEWARNHLLGLYHNEYYMIQQMNNQLVDAQRRLTRSNRQLEYALKENQEVNAKLEKARAYAEQASLSKTRFLANMSHDIRTPMNAIVGLAELMQYHLKEPEILKTYIAKLQSSSRYLLDLINDILDLSKIENGSMELVVEPMDIGKQIEQIVTIIRPQITKRNQKLSVQSDCTEFGYLLGDPVRFRQVLMNLFSNAVKYTPDGGNIRFIIHEEKTDRYGKNYQFIIEDSGIGMTPEFVEHIFEPFARADGSVREIQGTGLGMAITKSIVDAMGGSIHVKSTPGTGSRFCVELFFENCPEKELPDKKDMVPADSQKDEPVNLRGMRLMCAEDNELNAEILVSMLELEGAKCSVYKNGKLLADAFESVSPGEYDAILMDVQMPVMNGYEATRQIRNSKNPLGKTIPVIAMTANAFAEDVQKCIDAGMNAHIAKPIDIEKLTKTLASIRN